MEEDEDSHARGFDYDDNTSIDDMSIVSNECVNPNAVNKMMAQQIDKLSIGDRNAIYEEIHGVASMATKENPELISNALQSFQIELDKLHHSARVSYDSIMNQPGNIASKNILVDEQFRLRFLRFVFFDPRAAVARMMTFLDTISELYGLEALRQFDTTMGFFIDTKEAQAALRAGYLQLLPFRDRSGRRIIFFVMDALLLDSKTRTKIFLYLAFVAGYDVETQRCGCLLLFWPGVERLQLPESSHRSLVAKLVNNIPTRFVCFHFCFPNTPFYRMAQAMLSLCMSEHNFKRITRLKFHSGEQIELLYELMGYGVPVSLIPITGTGTLKVKTFLQWIKARKLLEIETKRRDNGYNLSNDLMDCPGLTDVIFRSAGKSCMLHPGNVAFRGMFEKYHDEHVNAGQTAKKNLVWKIVREIESRGGRFLTWDRRGWWIVLEDRLEIRSKVAVSLRDYNKQQKAISNKQVFKSSTYVFERQDGKRRKRSSDEDYSSDENHSIKCMKFVPNVCSSN